MLLELLFVKCNTMQIRNWKILLLVLLFPLFAVSCNNKVDTEMDYGTGKVIFDLSTTLTKAEIEEGSLNVDDFKIEIINDKGVIFKRWNSYAEYKAQEDNGIALNAHKKYTIRATYGNPTGVGWYVVYFKGETEFEVEPQKVKNVEVKCSMANAKIGVTFGKIMTTEYKDIVATVSNKYGSLVFTSKNLTESGYIPAEPLTLNVELVSNEDGKKRYFKKTGIEIQPGDYKVMNLDTEEIPEMGVVVNLTIDESTILIEETIDIPGYTLPVDAPVFALSGFDGTTGILNPVEGVAPAEANVSIDAEGKIASCKMDISSSYLLSLSVPLTIDFANIDEGTRNLLDRYGLYYPETIIGNELAGFDFKEFAKIFAFDKDEAKNTHTFTFTVTDELGKEVVQTVKIVPVEADKSISDIPEGDIWAKKVYMTLNTTNAVVSELFPELSTDGKTWTKATYQTLSTDGTSKNILVTGLIPGTAYQFRAAYRNNGAETVKSLITEDAAQIGNSGFEDYQLVVTQFTPLGGALGGGTYNRNWYLPYKSGESDPWWACNSMKSMPDKHTGWTSTWCKNFPSSGYVKDVHSGSKAAKLFCVDVGSDNTDGTAEGTTYNGEIWIGTADNSGNQATQGHAFASRPNKLVFWYKYSANDSKTFYVETWIKDAAGNVIASSIETAGGAASDWTKFELPFTYTNEDVKAASIYVWIASSNGKGRVDTGVSFELGEETVTAHAGCFLTIDDIELIYE